MFTLFVPSLPNKQSCFNAITEDPTRTWHCRYGHLSFGGLKTLEGKDMVQGLSVLKAPSKVCEGCLIGKQQIDSFPKESTWRASQILQLIHADICGPITPISNSNKRYFISFIDDFSQKTWRFFLAEKSKAFSIFKRFKSMVVKEIGIYLKGLRTDQGGEFTFKEFSSWQRLILRKKTV